ncbi:hypothetical protein GGS23DRAFT_254140 [Durotheca rogersii]|uniref:uncharacterized protein n=1 Tax=Durotheca rogersii TaxID=419775 RepID=UPI0022202FC4|nr:uncharacterized protein GGS23DRAFT_254140 [Durotheca rogersii]KAI5859921.1 hypothetical protein GGS23DRAFT_254140 [Durotheca rogersii]
MAWGGKSARVEVKASVFRQLLPLFILFAVLGGVAFVVYQIYLSVTKIRDNAERSMAKKNMMWTKDGLKVGVQHVEQEKYIDATQNWVVKAWNMGNPPPVKRK